MEVEGMRAYQIFSALSLHFNMSTNYDYFKYNGKVKPPNNLHHNRHYIHFQRLERRYKSNLEDFMIGNFVLSNRISWIGDLTKIEAEKKYEQWKSYSSDITALAKKEFESLSIKNISELIKVHDKSHPELLRAYLAGKISIFTMIALDKVLNFTQEWNVHITDKFIWPGEFRRISRTKGFLDSKIDTEAIKEILLAETTQQE